MNIQPNSLGSWHHSILKRVKNFTSEQFFLDVDTFLTRNCYSRALWRQRRLYLGGRVLLDLGSVFSLIVPSCDNECGERLTPRLPTLDTGHTWGLGPWEVVSYWHHGPEKTRSQSRRQMTREWEESDPKVLNIISLITLSCLNIKNLISNFRQLG